MSKRAIQESKESNSERNILYMFEMAIKDCKKIHMRCKKGLGRPKILVRFEGDLSLTDILRMPFFGTAYFWKL